MEFRFVFVNGHVEVFDCKGRFVFSADTEAEARLEIRQQRTEI